MLVLGESGQCGFTAAKDCVYGGMKRELWFVYITLNTNVLEAMIVVVVRPLGVHVMVIQLACIFNTVFNYCVYPVSKLHIGVV